MSRFGLCVVAVLWMLSCGMAGADEPALIDPETTVVTVDGVKLSAGMILVPVGGEFKEWWRGNGHDAETQKRVRAKLDEYATLAIDDEILRAMYDKILVDGRAASDEENRRALDEDLLNTTKVVRTQKKIDDWAKQAPDAEPHITGWQHGRAEATLMAILAARTWIQQPHAAAFVNNYWKEHQDQYTLLKSARWQQATVLNENAEDFQRQLDKGSDWGAMVQKYSTDRYHLKGGSVESTFPHLLIPERIVDTLRQSKPDQRTSCVNGHETTFIIVESVEVTASQYADVSEKVKADLARLKTEPIAKKLCEKKRAECRIEWDVSIKTQSPQ